MLIAYIGVASRERNGDWYYRTSMPCRVLAATDGVYTVEAPYIHRACSLLHAQADVLVVNMVGDPALLEVAKQRRERGQVTILEYNDDTIDAPHVYWSRPAHPFFIEMMRAFDGVQFSTWALHRRYSSYAKRAIVSQNMIDCSKVLKHDYLNRKELTIGWGGSYGHIPDLREIAPVVSAWARSKGDVKLLLMGDDRIYDLFDCPKSLYRSSGIFAYYKFLGLLDVGLAPLRPTPFNNGRSDIKFLEYAAAGVLPVLADQVPYHNVVQGEQALIYQEPGDLRDALEYLYRIRNAADAWRGTCRRAYEVARARHPDRIIATLLSWYRSMLGRRPGIPALLPEYDGSTSEGRYLSLGFGREEVATWERLRVEVDKQLQESTRV